MSAYRTIPNLPNHSEPSFRLTTMFCLTRLVNAFLASEGSETVEGSEVEFPFKRIVLSLPERDVVCSTGKPISQVRPRARGPNRVAGPQFRSVGAPDTIETPVECFARNPGNRRRRQPAGRAPRWRSTMARVPGRRWPAIAELASGASRCIRRRMRWLWPPVAIATTNRGAQVPENTSRLLRPQHTRPRGIGRESGLWRQATTRHAPPAWSLGNRRGRRAHQDGLPWCGAPRPASSFAAL